MFTSDKKLLVQTAWIYACAAAFCAFFGAVYEVFSHQVYSYFMIYAFALPLCLGTLPALLFALKDWQAPPRLARQLYHSGVAALTAGCIFEGVLRIYGTTNRLIWVYPVAGTILLLGGAGAWVVHCFMHNGNEYRRRESRNG